jgi:hypothetical protein
MRFLLDTNVVSELRKPRPHGGVRAWIEANKRDLGLPAPVIGEIQAGIEKARPQHPEKALAYTDWLLRLLEEFPFVAMDAVEFREWAKLMHGKQAHLYIDAMIAATARVHGLMVATRNVADFEPFGVATINPFD